MEASGSTSLKVRWKPPKIDLRHGRIRGYYVGYRLIQSSTDEVDNSYNYKNVELAVEPHTKHHHGSIEVVTSLKTSTKDASISTLSVLKNSAEPYLHTYLSNLQRKSQYSVIVQAYNLAGAGPRSDEARQSTLDGAPPITPKLEVIAAGASWLQLVWFVQPRTHQPTTSNIGISSVASLMHGQPPPPDPADYSVYYRLEAETQFHRRQIPSQSAAPTITSVSNGLFGATTPTEMKQTLGEYRLDGLRCGSRYELYITASNSLGTGEPSERLLSRTAGAAPVSPATANAFVLRNYTALILQLHRWKTGGCPVRFFSVQYRANLSTNQPFATDTSNALVALKNQEFGSLSNEPVLPRSRSTSTGFSAGFHNVRWTVIKKELSGSSRLLNRELVLQLPHLTPNTWYQLIVSARSDAGTTEEEYLVRTLNRSELDMQWISVAGVSQSLPESLPDLIGSQGNAANGYSMIGAGNSGSSEQLDGSPNSILAVQQLAVLAPLLATGVLLALIGAFVVICMRRQAGFSAGMINLQRLQLANGTSGDATLGKAGNKLQNHNIGSGNGVGSHPVLEQYTLSDYQRLQMSTDAAAVDALYGKLFAAAAAGCPIGISHQAINVNNTGTSSNGLSVSTGQLLVEDDQLNSSELNNACKQSNDTSHVLNCGSYYSSPLRKYSVGCNGKGLPCNEMIGFTSAIGNHNTNGCMASNRVGPHDYAEPYTQRCLVDMNVTPPLPPSQTSLIGPNLSNNSMTTNCSNMNTSNSIDVADSGTGQGQVRLVRLNIGGKVNEQMYATIKRGTTRNPTNFTAKAGSHI